MSDRVSIAPSTDRRVIRTRAAIMCSFVDLLGEQSWSTVSVDSIAARAEIARSTFYQHFRSKEDLLIASMASMLDLLESAGDPDCRVKLDQLLAHYWSNRSLARVVFGGPRAVIIERALRTRLANGLDSRMGLGAREMVAARVAAGRIAIIRGWTHGEFSASVRDVSDAIASCA
jgi:AcrR family transcriptional regulator